MAEHHLNAQPSLGLWSDWTHAASLCGAVALLVPAVGPWGTIQFVPMPVSPVTAPCLTSPVASASRYVSDNGFPFGYIFRIIPCINHGPQHICGTYTFPSVRAVPSFIATVNNASVQQRIGF